MIRHTAALWCGLAAIASALILCAAAVGAPLVAAAVMISTAVLEIIWGLWTLRAGYAVALRTALTFGAVVVAGSTVMLFLDVIGMVPFLALLALHWTAALVSLVSRRPTRESAPTRPGLFVLAITVQAMVIAALTTPALAATQPGASAMPHGVLHETHHH